MTDSAPPPHFQPRTRSRPIGLLLAGGLAVAAGIVTALNPSLLRALELQTQAWFFRLRGPVAPPTDIVILAIDDDSLARGRDSRDEADLQPIRSWPWRRSAYAIAIERLMGAGARAVALDVVLDVPSEYPEADAQLQAVLQRDPERVTLAATHATSATGGGGLEQLIFPDPLFLMPTGSVGLINYITEADGQFRRFTQVYLAQIDPALLDPNQPLLSFDRAALQAAQWPIAPPKGDYFFYYGPEYTFPTVSFWTVLDAQNWAVLERDQVFKDKLVLIGPTAAVLQDIHPTPFGRLPGVEIHANAIATLVEQRAIAVAIPNPQHQGILIVVGVLACGVLLHRLARRPMAAFLVAQLLAILWVSVAYVSLTFGSWILPVVLPTGAIGLSGLSFLLVGALQTQLEKLRLRRTLERYVAAPVVEEILAQPEDFRTLLQGRKVNAAVMFCDIRGFTSLSYKMPADELVAQLNTYLNAMVAAIAAARGTIDKFIGDAVMAEFGSPVSQGEKADALNAIQAALGMRRALAVLREQWQQTGKPLLYHGIGISYGEVIAGNIGSMQRLEYTVIGDAANVASRVEGLTKQLHTDLLITEPLYRLVQDEIDAIDVGEHTLRGREANRMRLYQVIGYKGDDSQLYEQIHQELAQLLH